MIGTGNNRYQLLDVEDLCEAIRLCLTLPEERVDDTFNIGAAEFASDWPQGLPLSNAPILPLIYH